MAKVEVDGRPGSRHGRVLRQPERHPHHRRGGPALAYGERTVLPAHRRAAHGGHHGPALLHLAGLPGRQGCLPPGRGRRRALPPADAARGPHRAQNHLPARGVPGPGPRGPRAGPPTHASGPGERRRGSRLPGGLGGVPQIRGHRVPHVPLPPRKPGEPPRRRPPCPGRGPPVFCHLPPGAPPAGTGPGRAPGPRRPYGAVRVRSADHPGAGGGVPTALGGNAAASARPGRRGTGAKATRRGEEFWAT